MQGRARRYDAAKAYGFAVGLALHHPKAMVLRGLQRHLLVKAFIGLGARLTREVAHHLVILHPQPIGFAVALAARAQDQPFGFDAEFMPQSHLVSKRAAWAAW